MHVIIHFKATSWKQKIILAIVSLMMFLVNDTLIAIFNALGLHMSDQWRKLDPEECSRIQSSHRDLYFFGFQ